MEQKQRVDSKAVPKNISLKELLRPRNVAIKPENQKKWEQEKEAEDYMNRMYGASGEDGADRRSGMDSNVKEILDLALGDTLVEMPKIIPAHKVTYRLDLGFKNGVYVGGKSEIPEIIISDYSMPAKSRVINQDEFDVLRGVLDVLENKEKKDTAATKKKAAIAMVEPQIEASDSDSDIFEDAGTDYVLETRSKPVQDRKTEGTGKQKYFKDTAGDEKEASVDIYMPEGLAASSKLKTLLENSHKLKRDVQSGDANDIVPEEKDGNHDSDSDHSVHMLEDIASDDGINYDYDEFYSDDEEGGELKSKLAGELANNLGANKLNQEFQKMGKVYESKFGESLHEKKEGKKRPAESGSSGQHSKKPKPKK